MATPTTEHKLNGLVCALRHSMLQLRGFAMHYPLIGGIEGGAVINGASLAAP